jgi:hypothetical protein
MNGHPATENVSPMKKAKPKMEAQKPEPMVFEHAPVESTYDRIAKRVMAAAEELNNALREAHECTEMRVFIGSGKPDGHAMRYEPVIYRMTHATLSLTVKFREEPQMGWRHVKRDDFEDAAGSRFAVLKK